MIATRVLLRLQVQMGDRSAPYDIHRRRFFMEQHYTLEFA